MSKYYCFPDIHGCSDVLQDALQFVYKNNPEGGKIVFLGDYIDRGPDNLGVIRTVMNPPEGWEFICLMGNHEQMFTESYHIRSRFWDMNAAYDLAELNVDDLLPFSAIHAAIPLDIVKWMEQLKIFHIEGHHVFAHAFYDDTRAPEDQIEQVCLWDRMSDGERYWNDNQKLYLTHGHTPRPHAPVKAVERINLDAGPAVYGRYVIAEYDSDFREPVALHEFKRPL